MVHILKVFMEKPEGGKPEIRRLAVSSDTLSSYNLLCGKVLSLFPSLAGKCFVLSWKDSEDDDIVMSSDEELAQAVANGEDGLIKVFVKYITMNEGSAGAFKPIPNTGEVHPNIVCDSCNGEVKGYRYKCLECEDYDLCSTCNALDKHQKHDMVKIATSTMYPHHWLFPGWRRMWRSMFGHHAFYSKRSHCPEQKFKPKEFCKQMKKQTEDFENMKKLSKSKETFFKTLEESMMHLLDPFGIDVELDVLQSEGEQGATGGQREAKETAKKPKETAEKPKESEEKPKETEEKSNKETKKQDAALEETVPKTATKEAQLSEASNDVGYASGPVIEDFHQSPRSSSPLATQSIAEAKTAPLINLSSNGSENSSGIPEGWTVVNAESTNEKPEASAPEVIATPNVEVRYPKLPEEDNMSGANNNNTPNPQFFIPDAIPADPQIANALAKMSAMGFSNEGGWLTRLLQTKCGNINDVIDALYPNMPNRR